MKNTVKVMMAMVMMFAVLISGCANKEDEWNKAHKEFTKHWNNLIVLHDLNEKEAGKALREIGPEEVGNVNARFFYKMKEVVPEVEVALQKMEKIAKESDNKKWKDETAYLRQQLNKDKAQTLHFAGPSYPGDDCPIPNDDLNWNKEVKHPDIKEKLLNGEIKAKPKIYNEDFTIPKDENAPWKSNSNSNDSKQESKPAEVKANDGKAGIITGTEVRMRQAASTDAKILGYFDKGETVTILGSKNGWHKVRRSNGAEGFVSADFCKTK